MANQVNVSTTTNTVTITPQDTTNVSVGTTNTSVNVTQGSTSVVQVTTQGPQGPVGPMGPTGDANLLTGSLLTTASVNLNTLTFTKGDNTEFSVTVNTGSTPTLAQVTAQGSSTITAITASIISASGFITASNLASITQLNASSSTLQSNIDTKASIDQLNASSSTLQTNIDAKANIASPSFTGAITASIISASGIISASNLSGNNTGDQDLSSFVQNNQTGSLLTTASIDLNTLTFTKGNNTTFAVTVNTGSTPTLAEVTAQGSSTTTAITVSDTIISGTLRVTGSTILKGPTFISGADALLTNQILTVQTGSANKLGFRDIDPRVFGNTLVSSSGGTEGQIPIFGSLTNSVIGSSGLTFNISPSAILTVGTDARGKTIISEDIITSSIISASTEIIGDTKRDSFTRGFFRTSDGIANRSSYFLEADINDTTAHSLSNYASPTPISSSQYYKLVIPCDDMSTPISLDISGVLRVQGAVAPSSPGIKIDVYTASMTPNSLINDPLTFNRAFIGDTINLNSSLTTQSIHVTQSFDISSLSSNSLLAIALSNASTSTAVTTEPNGVSISLKISRNYKKEN